MDFKWSGFFLFTLAGLILVTLLAIVHLQHQIRSLESQYYSSMQQNLLAKEEWGKLMLEKKHLTSPVMVEKVAREQLDMSLDKAHFREVYLEPEMAEPTVQIPVPVEQIISKLEPADVH
jgi:cell division protein FtsL